MAETPIRLRSEPKDYTNCDLSEIGNLIRQHNFFCRKYEWNLEFCNEEGTCPGDYVDHADGTITDRSTGLMWQQAHRVPYGTLSEAKQYIQQLNAENFAGYSDWRLPTLEECASLMSSQKNKDGLFSSPLFTPRLWLWTCDVRDTKSGLVWNANLLYGSVFWIDPVNGQDVRAVRTAMNAPGRQLLQDYVSYLVSGDTDRLVRDLYDKSAELVTFRGVYKGHDQIRRAFVEVLPAAADTIRRVQVTRFRETDDLVLWQADMDTQRKGPVSESCTFCVSEGKITKQMCFRAGM